MPSARGARWPALGGAFGVILGGVLTSYLSWRWVFYRQHPDRGRGRRRRPHPAAGEPRSPDAERAGWTSRARCSATGGLALLVYTIVSTDVHPWGSARTLRPARRLRRPARRVRLHPDPGRRTPLMPLALFRSRSVTAANLVMLLLGVVFFSMWYFLSLYLQDVHGYGAAQDRPAVPADERRDHHRRADAGRVMARVGPQRLLVVGLGMSRGGLRLADPALGDQRVRRRRCSAGRC